MNKFFKTEVKVKELWLTKWHEDPNALGGYSFCKVGQEQEEWTEELRTPIEDKIWFVGEYLHPKIIGCAHTAYETGYWAAEEVIEAI